MQLPGHGSHRDGNNSFPNPILWNQRNIASTQDLFNQEGDGAYPYAFFFQPPVVPAAPNPLIPWSGLPPSGGFTPFTPFMLPATYYVSPSFPTNQGYPGGYGLDSGGGSGGISVTYDDGTSLVTVDEVTTLDFGNWASGFVYENPPGSGVITIDPPTGTGTTGDLTVTPSPGPLSLPSGNSFSGNITLDLDYDTTNSFNSATSQLRLKSITTTSSVLGNDELISQVTTDGFGRFTDYKKINVDTTDSFDSTVPSGDLALKSISPPVTAQGIDSTTSTSITTILTVDSKARVQSQTTRDIGMFVITKAERISGNTYWEYTMRRLYDSDSSLNPITAFPFTEDRGPTYTAYNGLEVGNSASFVYGLDVDSTVGTGNITLDGTYQGFEYGPVPLGTVVMAMKEGNVNAKWWFTAPNKITGVCPSPEP